MALHRGQRAGRAAPPTRHGKGRIRQLQHFRRTAAAGVVAGVAFAAVALGAPAAHGQSAPPGGAGPTSPSGGFNKGTGSAIAESLRLDPVAGGLSFGMGVGEALAGHQNTAATAESRAANLGVIGTTLAAEGCDGGDPTLPRDRQPQALRVESGEEGAEEGKSGQDPVVPGVDRQVRATTAPYAEALTMGGNLDIPGVLSVQGTRSFASSGVEGDLRRAIARTEIDRMVIAGLVELRGMVWEADHRTGSVDEQTATFTLGSMLIAGTPVPFDDPTAALSEANELLRQLGLEVRPPRAHFDDTARGRLATVDPLGIRVVPSPLRSQLVDPALSQAQPAREELFQALIEMDCGNASYITVLDIVLSAFGSGGYFAVELGGVQATTAAINLYQGLGSGPLLPGRSVLPASGVRVPAGGSGSAAAASGTTGGTPSGQGAGAGGATPEHAIDDAVDASTDGSRGGLLAAVAATGLGLLLVAAEADRRAIRRAAQMIPMEA